MWGTAWLAMKVGIATVPPAFFAGTRWAIAGLVLLAWRDARGEPVKVPFRPVRLGRRAQRGADAGVASGIRRLLGQEKFKCKQAAAIAAGVAGILILFGPKTATGAFGWPQRVTMPSYRPSWPC
ncbi:MAG: hypothetical protein JO122_19775 [Acetobacteraceae bacterium]|nr:hypothetical protein [Acetobacteraceae bacterium]